MSVTVRRVVTGHDQNGRATATIDEIVKNVVQGRPGAHAAAIWTTEGFPVDNDGDADASARKVGTTLANGTIFRVVSFGPGVAARNHRTDSIDYATVIAGEIDMELDGETVHLKAGDVLVQRGTIQGHRALHHRLRAGGRQAGDRRRQGAQRRGLRRAGNAASKSEWPGACPAMTLPLTARGAPDDPVRRYAIIVTTIASRTPCRRPHAPPGWPSPTR